MKHRKPQKKVTTSSLRDAHADKLHAALAIYQQGDVDGAQVICLEIVQSKPDHFNALQLLATIALQKKNFIDAVDLFEKAIIINPNHPSLLNNYGNALLALKRYEEALLSYDKALALKPDYAEASCNRGVALHALKRDEEALLSYDKALALKPDYMEASTNRDNVLQVLTNDEKMDSFISAVLRVTSWLRTTESMSLESQRKMQEEQLSDLFRHAWKCSDWWQKRLSQAGYRNDGDGSVFGVLENMPPLLRTDLQEHFEALRAWKDDWTEKDMITSTTSGSTGLPVRVEKFRPLYNLIYEAVALVDHEWHGRDARQTLAIIGTDQDDSVLPDWGPLLVAVQGSGGAVMNRFSLSFSSDEHAAWLMEHRPVYMKCSSRLASEIAESLILQGKTLPLHHIISQSERVTPFQREVCRKAFNGAKIIDRYSCEECGWLALQCPHHDHFHSMSGTTLLEIVDDHFMPCPVGVAGRVLVTSLHSYAMPIIRYDIGDIAEWGEECDCGIKLPVISHLWGRKRNLIMLPNGDTRPMYFLGVYVAEIPVIKEYRVIQQKTGEIDFFVRADRPLLEEEADKLRSFIFKVDAQLMITIHEVSVIDWGTGLKREEFVRLET